ncbi:GNAT family N-acetyltransferase [Oceanomicrobium pacificus]|uniref:GNAT family N-acetyltransferase n=1 Tax=Oceanomicrobium pacificus TaxID=2692916 RepID=A0A6B0TKU6_9RHOB|nr:GNAT family N-acetyltransferase [Oceanomicrobium pacificus]MXU64486.1 GNAT family N-acetyltransferase [Oceanomicrobium pacificus]
MTPEAMATIHAASFTVPRPWSAAEFARLLADPAVLAITRPQGFALFRQTGTEAELLTIAVAPDARRQGLAQAILLDGLDRLGASGAVQIFLEVAAGNGEALALYRATGFTQAGLRPGYFRDPADGTRHDALVLRKDIAPAAPARDMSDVPN